MAQFWKRLMLLRKRLENLRVLRILGEINSGLNEYSVSENLKNGVYGIDLSKLVISCRGCRKKSIWRTVRRLASPGLWN